MRILSLIWIWRSKFSTQHPARTFRCPWSSSVTLIFSLIFFPISFLGSIFWILLNCSSSQFLTKIKASYSRVLSSRDCKAIANFVWFRIFLSWRNSIWLKQTPNSYFDDFKELELTAKLTRLIFTSNPYILGNGASSSSFDYTFSDYCYFY